MSPSSLELKISPFHIGVSLFAVLVLLIYLPGRFLWSLWHKPGALDITSSIIATVFALIVIWWIYVISRPLWIETGLYLRVDDQEAIVKTRGGRRVLKWDEIYGLTRDGKSATGEKGQWLSLRGCDDQVLAQWDRNWCRFTNGQKRRSDQIENFIGDKLRAMGRFQDEEKAASQVWESLHPLGVRRGLEVRTNYGWVGWAGVCVLLPCAVLSRAHPTGGPIVSFCFLLFAVLSAYVISAQGSLLINENKIETASLWGLYRMQWSEVHSLELDEQGNSLTFSGSDKRLCFSGPRHWKEHDKQEMLLYLAARCEKYGIT